MFTGVFEELASDIQLLTAVVIDRAWESALVSARLLPISQTVAIPLGVVRIYFLVRMLVNGRKKLMKKNENIILGHVSRKTQLPTTTIYDIGRGLSAKSLGLRHPCLMIQTDRTFTQSRTGRVIG
jgi:hypothetical protein